MKAATRQRTLPLLCLICMASVAIASTDAIHDPDAQGCAAELDRAEIALREALSDHRHHRASVEKALELHRKVFAECEAATLSLEDTAHLADRRARYLAIYEKDDHAALVVYRKALIEVTAAGGVDHPARIRLLEGEADVLTQLAGFATADDASALKERAFEDLHEALRVRRVNYGEDSVEVAQASRLLAVYYSTEDLAAAEKLGQTALQQFTKILGIYDPEVLRTVSVLSFIYRDQGREARAEEMFALYSQISDELERRGIAID